jgi:hypothetical protein
MQVTDTELDLDYKLQRFVVLVVILHTQLTQKHTMELLGQKLMKEIPLEEI